MWTPALLLCAAPALLSPATFHEPLHEGHTGSHEHGPHHAQEATKWVRPTPPSEPTMIGSGAHTYRWNANWLQLPKGKDWLGSTHGCIALDHQGRVYLSAETGATILVYGPDGKLLDSFGKDWGGGVHGLSIVTSLHEEPTPSADGSHNTPVVKGEWATDDAKWNTHQQTLWIAHTARQEVLQTTLEGKVLQTLGWPEQSGKYESKGQYRPTSVAVGPKGIIFVADGYGRSWIHRYSPDGRYLDSFGGPGKAVHQLQTPHGLWLDWNSETPTLLVADREKHRLVRFSLTGEYLTSTDSESGMLRRPCHVQFHGKLGVVSDLAGRITLIDDKLNLVAQLGDNPDKSQWANYNVLPQDWKEGAFCAPHCARLDAQGNLYVMDWNVAGRFTRLERQAPKRPTETK